MKEYSKKDNPVMLSGYQFILGGIVMVLLRFGMGGRIPHVSVSALLMLFIWHVSPQWHIPCGVSC